MSEHSMRYHDFACHLASQGYLFCMCDHRGNGETWLANKETHPVFADAGPTLWHAMLEDSHALRELVMSGPDGLGPNDTPLPVHVFGHSYGSMLAQAYIVGYGKGVSSACFTGPAARAPAALRAAFNIGLGPFLNKADPEAHSPFYHGIVDGSFNKKFNGLREKAGEGETTGFEWLNSDSSMVDVAVADPLFSVSPSPNRHYQSLLSLTKFLSDKKVFRYASPVTVQPMSPGLSEALDRQAKEQDLISSANADGVRVLPVPIPVLYLSGKDDPVGGFGKNCMRQVKWLTAMGWNVSAKVYPGMRHEILLEPRKAEVYTDIMAHLEAVERQGSIEGVVSLGKAKVTERERIRE
ncbi:hypothetical protein KIPB_007126 [Kipferlia bialata]|uniref:Serine aminopeptidase S33 domain-containing protein n=1 Tax=Kipferlia bialata TaxID=797122 RepID=A0A9K3CY20_9EUKA|nr:hypothetical protein KIPB_007126 [Kipferlia bialata]|eukprot:g7126.t1